MCRKNEQRVVSPEEQVGFVIGNAESRELLVWVKQFSDEAALLGVSGKAWKLTRHHRP